MIFNHIEYTSKYNCIDWVDHLDDELQLGVIDKSKVSGFYYFKPNARIVIECGSAKRISDKLRELNKEWL